MSQITDMSEPHFYPVPDNEKTNFLLLVELPGVIWKKEDVEKAELMGIDPEGYVEEKNISFFVNPECVVMLKPWGNEEETACCVYTNGGENFYCPLTIREVVKRLTE